MRQLYSMLATLVALACVSAGSARQLPSDVRPNHWAAPAITQLIQAGVVQPGADGLFHGDAKVTRTEVAKALAIVGQALVDGSWKPAGHSRPVPDSVSATWAKTSWKTEPVRRYAFAAMLARFADYAANGLPRPVADAKVGMSTVLPKVTVSVSKTDPAYDALTYLIRNRMVRNNSPLFKTNASALTGGDLGQAFAQFAYGITDRVTEVGKDAEGNTDDSAFHKKPLK